MAEGVSFKDRWERLRARQQNEAERQHEMLATGIDTALVHLGAAGFAALHGYKGGMPTIARMPVDGVVGGIANVAGFVLMMTGRSWGRHVVAFGTGPSVWLTAGMAAKWGNEMRKKKGLMKNVEPSAKEQEDNNLQYRQPIVYGPGGAPRQPPLNGAYVRQGYGVGVYA